MSRGWDCHAHLFGPYDRFPLAPDRSYTPPEAVEAQYIALLEQLGLSNGVLVHPSAYGEDFSLLFAALASRPQLRGVIVARPGTLPTLKGLREKGVRAVRVSHRSGAGTNFAGSASFEDLLALAPQMADAGLHAEMWTDCKVLPDIAPAIRKLPFPMVIDHMGGFDAKAGVDDPGFRTLVSLVEEGVAWVKMTAYRSLLPERDIEVARPFHDLLVKANPERVVWGSDWPFLRVAPAPDAVDLLAVLKGWMGSGELVDRILIWNPEALYA